MAGFTDAYELVVLDDAFDNTDYIAYSENGSSETSNLARTSIGTWAAGTNVSGTGTKANAGALESAAATGNATITHFAVFSASTSGTQKTDWTALTGGSKALTTGDKLSIASGALAVTLD